MIGADRLPPGRQRAVARTRTAGQVAHGISVRLVDPGQQPLEVLGALFKMGCPRRAGLRLPGGRRPRPAARGARRRRGHRPPTQLAEALRQSGATGGGRASSRAAPSMPGRCEVPAVVPLAGHTPGLASPHWANVFPPGSRALPRGSRQCLVSSERARPSSPSMPQLDNRGRGALYRRLQRRQRGATGGLPFAYSRALRRHRPGARRGCAAPSGGAWPKSSPTTPTAGSP